MAVMDEPSRTEASFDFQKALSRQAVREELGVTKAELKAAVDALDQFLSDNQVAINNALPAAAKANLTTPQKARLMIYVVEKRYLTGA